MVASALPLSRFRVFNLDGRAISLLAIRDVTASASRRSAMSAAVKIKGEPRD
jgi:hypothetical protein